jgi:transcription initiation factor TFIID subunit TAF12
LTIDNRFYDKVTTSVIEASIQLATHRNSKEIDVQDIQLILGTS